MANVRITAVVTMVCADEATFQRARAQVEAQPGATEIVVSPITRTITYVLTQDAEL